jgi:hypothetical protein
MKLTQTQNYLGNDIFQRKISLENIKSFPLVKLREKFQFTSSFTRGRILSPDTSVHF